MSRQTFYRCQVCGRDTSGRRPEGGDGSFMYPRLHKTLGGGYCEGSEEEALMVDVEVPARPQPWEKSAILSRCQSYRYLLTRTRPLAVAETPGTVLWLMLNPSTADADVDDATIRRCQGFTAAWGYSSLAVVNLFAFRTTNPRVLYTCPHPVGEDNDQVILSQARMADIIVAAWGSHGVLHGRGLAVRELLAPHNLYALALTKGAEPSHPLRLGKHLRPFLWRGLGEV